MKGPAYDNCKMNPFLQKERIFLDLWTDTYAMITQHTRLQERFFLQQSLMVVSIYLTDM